MTDAVVTLHLHHYQRVPTTAYTRMLRGDLLVCVLGGLHGEIEKTGADLSRSDAPQPRRAMTQDSFVSAIERLSGRQVLASAASSDVGRDLAVELFMLHRDEPRRAAA